MAVAEILASVIIVSLVSFIGIATLSLRKGLLNKILLILVAFGAGGLLGGALFDLLPEAVEMSPQAFQYIAGGIVLFFIIEKLIHWKSHRHIIEHDHPHDQKKPFAYLNLLAEGIHNFLDGVIIAAAYLTGFELGVVATIAIILHELPQEIGDFGILVHGGFTVRRALYYNFLIALTAVLGAIAAILAAPLIPGIIPVLIAVAGGGFLYIAMSSLIPELHHETQPAKIVVQTLFLILGMLLLLFVGMAFPE